MSEAEIDLPAAGAERQYQRHLANGTFRLQQCDDCGVFVFYPRYGCPQCGSPNLTWEKASGLGVVYSTTISRRRPDRGGDFNISLIELQEGPRLMSRVENIPPGDVEIGMPVRARIAGGGGEDEDEDYMLVFDPVEVENDG